MKDERLASCRSECRFFQSPEAVEGEVAELFGVRELAKLGFPQMKAFAGSQDKIVKGSRGFDQGGQVVLVGLGEEKFVWAVCRSSLIRLLIRQTP